MDIEEAKTDYEEAERYLREIQGKYTGQPHLLAFYEPTAIYLLKIAGTRLKQAQGEAKRRGVG